MRLWSLDPDLLDRAALVSGWREGLLAQKVLQGLTKGYRHHPQLDRFRAADDPVGAIGTWLHGLADAADRRGYRFDRTRVVREAGRHRIPVTDGQLALELAHLRRKVAERDPQWLPRLAQARPHPMLEVVRGPVEPWEREAMPVPER